MDLLFYKLFFFHLKILYTMYMETIDLLHGIFIWFDFLFNLALINITSSWQPETGYIYKQQKGVLVHMDRREFDTLYSTTSLERPSRSP